MIISDIDFFLVELPQSPKSTAVRSVLVRLAAQNGCVGWGEMHLPWRADELHDRREHLLPVLCSRSVFDIEDLIRIDELANENLRWGIETACWDLIGAFCEQPICHFFGGEYRQQIPLVAQLDGEEPDTIAEMAMELANQGFHWQSYTLSGNVKKDRQTVRLILDTLGHRIELRLDGHCRFSMDDAFELCRDWEDSDISAFVDPLLSNSISELQTLQSQTVLPIGVRRAIHSPQDFLAIIRKGSSLFPVVEPSRLGSIQATRKIAALAESAGTRVALACLPSVGISAAATIQLIASLPPFSSVNEGLLISPYYSVLRDGDAFEVSDGLLRIPQGNGIGVNVEREKIDRFLVS